MTITHNVHKYFSNPVTGITRWIVTYDITSDAPSRNSTIRLDFNLQLNNMVIKHCSGTLLMMIFTVPMTCMMVGNIWTLALANGHKMRLYRFFVLNLITDFTLPRIFQLIHNWKNKYIICSFCLVSFSCFNVHIWSQPPTKLNKRKKILP